MVCTVIGRAYGNFHKDYFPLFLPSHSFYFPFFCGLKIHPVYFPPFCCVYHRYLFFTPCPRYHKILISGDFFYQVLPQIQGRVVLRHRADIN